MEIIKILLIVVLILAILSLGILITKPIIETERRYNEYGDFRILSSSESEEPKYLIDVNGVSELSADPEKVEVYLGVETTALTAKESQENNADTMQAIRDSLKLIGISSKDIETTEYTLNVIQHWDEDTEKYIITGYKTTHIIKIESTDINKAGDIIDKSVQNGANKVNDVVFSLTDEKIKEMKLEALKKAGINAKEKADVIANSLGITIKGVYRASENYVYYTPYVQKGYEMAAMQAASTEISPGQIKISASLSVSYEFT